MEMPNHIMLHDLQDDKNSVIKVMICRKWDAITPKGFFLSTDYLISDEKGTTMQCSAKGKIADCFTNKLNEGQVYFISKFKVVKKNDKYRIVPDKEHIIELQYGTEVVKSTDSIEGYQRYPFYLVEFDQVESIGGKYLIDILCLVTSVGDIIEPKTDNHSQRLDVVLMNERGETLKATFWGTLAKEFKTKNALQEVPYVVLMTSMIVKEFCGVFSVSSSSATSILDSEEIPVLKAYKNKFMNGKFPVEDMKMACIEDVQSLSELLHWGRNSRDQVRSFKVKAKIIGVQPRSKWFYLACTSGTCKKGVKRQIGTYHCESCEEDISRPIPRFRLQLQVSDDNINVVFCLFDETAQILLKTTAKELLDASAEHHNGTSLPEENGPSLPGVIANLIGTTCIFEAKSSTYFSYADFETFTCGRVTKVPDTSISVGSIEKFFPADKMATKETLVSTPAKVEYGTRRKTKVQKLDLEDDKVATPVQQAQKKKKCMD